MNQYLGQGPGYSFIHALKENKDLPPNGAKPLHFWIARAEIFIHSCTKRIKICLHDPFLGTHFWPEYIENARKTKDFHNFRVHSWPPASTSQRGSSGPGPDIHSFMHLKEIKDLPGQARAAPRSSPGPDIHSFMH